MLFLAGLGIDDRGVEVEQSADMRLVVAHPRGKECDLSGEILDQNFDKMTLHLFMSHLIHQDIGFGLVSQPVLNKGRP